MKRDCVASCYIFSPFGRILLIHHKKLGVWLPPGGHVEENELPHEACLREVMEETGLKVELIRQEPLVIQEWNAVSIPAPFLLLLENIPAWKDVPAHQHIDHLYLATSSSEITSSHYEEECRWFTLEEIDQLLINQQIFSETKQLLKYLFTEYGEIQSKIDFQRC